MYRRIAGRIGELELADVSSYRAYLDEHPEEWEVLDACCRVTISRFYRDRGVWELLEHEVLPVLVSRARLGTGQVAAWSAGCASGEEPYTLAVLWRLALEPSSRAPELRIVATDVDETVLARARRGCYERGSVRDLPTAWLEKGFARQDDRYCVRAEIAGLVSFLRHDVRRPAPAGPFDLVLCRNLAFTYFEPPVQETVLRHLRRALRPGGVLVIGTHERLPGSARDLLPWRPGSCVYHEGA